MNILTSLAQILRPTSKPEGVFVIRPGYDSLRILQEAEDWSLLTGVGAWVVFMPGVHEIRYTFEFFHIAKILGHGIGSTKLRRYGNAWLKSVRNYAEIAHAPEISGFEIENMVETSEPAIELGSCQNAKLSEVYHWGAPADFLLVTNAERTETPPPGKPVGTWTENITLERIVIYGPRSAGLRFQVTDPRFQGQSFSRLIGEAQITLTVPGSIGVDFPDHCHPYGGEWRFKFNCDDASLGQAVCINIGNEGNAFDNFYNCFVEGRGIRIRVAPSARVTGHGQFTRQLAEHSRDEITPGQNWKGLPAGYVEWGILRDQIKI